MNGKITFFKRVPAGFLGANCYMLAGAGNSAAVIDPGADYEKLKEALEGNGFKAEAVLLTHGHFDHCGAAKKFQDAGARICMHKADAEMIRDFKADVYVSDGDVLNVAGLSIKVMHTPGHSLGGVCYYTDGTLFSGDTLFHGDVGRTDLKGGDFGQIKKSIQEKLYTLPDDTKVYPGHEEETTTGEEKRGNHYVKG